MRLQTWAHPKFGDRLDVGLVRQVEDGVDAMIVRSPSASLAFLHKAGLHMCLLHVA